VRSSASEETPLSKKCPHWTNPPSLTTDVFYGRLLNDIGSGYWALCWKSWNLWILTGCHFVSILFKSYKNDIRYSQTKAWFFTIMWPQNMKKFDQWPCWWPTQNIRLESADFYYCLLRMETAVHINYAVKETFLAQTHLSLLISGIDFSFVNKQLHLLNLERQSILNHNSKLNYAMSFMFTLSMTL